MDDLGARLKLAREDKGISLREIAAHTKISVVALEALERNDFTRLPGGIFGRAFVRAYALEIGLDPDETVSEFQVHLERSEREAAERGATRTEISSDDRAFLERQRRALRVLRLVAGGVLLVVLAVVAWRARSWLWRPSQVPPPTAMPAQPGGQALPQVAPPELPHVAQPAAESPAPPADAPAERPPATQAPATAPVVASLPAAVENALTIDVEVTASCWIYAAVDGVKLFSRLFRPGDRERLTAKGDILLDVGNAGALEWTINGKKARPLGRPGVHVKTVVTRATVGDFID